jgi:hypothetical protein
LLVWSQNLNALRQTSKTKSLGSIDETSQTG